jgi:hypothetical protein
MFFRLVCVLVILAVVSGKIYFQEDFNDAGWESRWVVPTNWKPKVCPTANHGC